MQPYARRAIEQAARIILSLEFRVRGKLCPVCGAHLSHFNGCQIESFLDAYGRPVLGLPATVDETAEWEWPGGD